MTCICIHIHICVYIHIYTYIYIYMGEFLDDPRHVLGCLGGSWGLLVDPSRLWVVLGGSLGALGASWGSMVPWTGP